MSSKRPLYVVSNWDAHFESYESKRLQRCSWVPIPNKHDGKSFRRLMREIDAAAIYGAWILTVQVASKCPVRGVLADLDGPLDAIDLEDKTGIPADTIERMTDLVTSDRIGWLVKVTDEGEISRILAQVARIACGKQRKPNGQPSGAPADSSKHPQTPADSERGPQVPADSDTSPHSAGDAAESRTAPAVCRTSHACAGEKEGKAGKAIPPIVPQGGHSASAQGDFENTCTPIPAADSAKKKERGGADGLEDAKRRIADLFGRKVGFFGAEAEHALAELQRAGVLPLPEEDWQMLAWWFALPKDEKDSDLRNRRQHAETLARNLLSEIERARGFAKKTGALPLVKKDSAPVDLGRLRTWFSAQWPEKALPNSLEDLPDYLRDSARKACSSDPVNA